MSGLNGSTLPLKNCAKVEADRAEQTGRLFKRSAEELGAISRGPKGLRAAGTWFVNELPGNTQYPVRSFPAICRAARQTALHPSSPDML